MAETSSPSSEQGSSSGTHGRKRRPALSCDPCISRKVKCDRMSPCRACALRGEAELCVYRLTPSNRKAISQLEEIDRLRTELDRHKSALKAASSKSTPQSIEQVARAPLQRSGQLDGLIGQLVDSISNDPKYPWSSWIANVATEAQNNRPILEDSLLALSMARCGAQDGKTDLQLNGHNLYISTLARLQRELYDPTRASQPEVLFATFLLSLYELIVLNDPMASLTHVNGIGRLIQHRGPANHVEALEHQTFAFFRLHGLILHILLRIPTFLSNPEWKNIPWSRSYPSKNLFDLLLDIVLDIPTMFAMGDQLEKHLSGASSASPPTPEGFPSKPSIPYLKEQLSAHIHRFEQSLEQWRRDWVHTYPGVPPMPASDLPSSSTITSLAALYAAAASTDTLLALSLNVYYAAHLLLLRLRAGFGQSPIFPPADLVRLIADTAEAQLAHESDFFAALGLLLPLRVAYFTPLADPQLTERLRALFAALETHFGFTFVPPVLNFLPGFGASLTLEDGVPSVEPRSAAATSSSGGFASDGDADMEEGE